MTTMTNTTNVTAKKMTKKEYFVQLRAIVADNKELVDFIDHEIYLLEKKSASSKKPSKNQIENEGFKASIIAFLTEQDTAFSIKEMQAGIPEIQELSNQRITHLLTALVKDEKVTKTYVKKTPYFAIARQ